MSSYALSIERIRLRSQRYERMASCRARLPGAAGTFQGGFPSASGLRARGDACDAIARYGDDDPPGHADKDEASERKHCS
jgi:hypothetical protein